MAFGETVTLITRIVTGRNADGNDVYGEISTPWPGTVFAPAGSTETLGGQDTVTTTAAFIWVDNIPDLTAYSAIRRPNGDEYEVVGTPSDFSSPYSGREVLQANVNRIA
jgi:hypothetical protein